MNLRLVAIRLALLATGGAFSLQAAELPQSGTFTARWTARGQVERVPFPDHREPYIVWHHGELFLIERHGMPHALETRCIGFGEQGVKAEGRCEFRDADGDSFYAELTTVGLTPGAPVTGVIVGGTGKYKGIRGDLRSDGWDYGSDVPEDDLVHAYMDAITGTWTIQ